MQNSVIEQQLNDLKENIHNERREDRSTINNALSKLTEAVTQLTVSMAESNADKKSVTRRLDIVEELAKQSEASFIALDKEVSLLRPAIDSNTLSKEKQSAFYWRVGEKVVMYAILGGIAAKLSGVA